MMNYKFIDSVKPLKHPAQDGVEPEPGGGAPGSGIRRQGSRPVSPGPWRCFLFLSPAFLLDFSPQLYSYPSIDFKIF